MLRSQRRLGIRGEVAQRGDVVKHAERHWRVAACFGKYYGRWALVTDPVPFTDNYHLMLRALHVDKKCKPYVMLNLHQKPAAVIATGSKCSSAGYTLLSAGDAPSKPKKFKTGVDMWD